MYNWKKEKLIKYYIENNFNKFFPNLILIKREYYIPSIWYADFYWVVKNSNKVFLIELKIGSNNPNQQLIAYRWGLMKKLNIKNEKNILLIWINEKINKNNVISEIEYYEYKHNQLTLKHKNFK